VLNVLAEPNLIALSGQQASFLAGGQFPVPVPQSGGGLTNNVTIQFKNFGVQLSFVPFVLDDETIRLQVAPEVSSIDFSLGTTLVQGGREVPGLSTRRVETTVELKQGSTLALAGLLQVDLDARTQRIPGIGDLPYIGPLFSNTSHKRVEKELLVLVTPYLIQPMSPDQVPPVPGSEIKDPNDKEFYFLNRIEGRTGRDFRSTTSWDNAWHLVERMKLEQCYMQGPVGYSP
jgi:pilus assembly protein CpaC